MAKSAFALLPFAASLLLASPSDQHRTWSDYGGGHDQSKFTTLSQITRENVTDLEIAWMYPTGDERSYQFNPVVAHGVMYVLAKENSLVAIDLDTGKEIWIHAHLSGISRRGISYWESEDGSDRRLLFTLNNTLQAIDARTGKSILSFGDNGMVDLRRNMLRDPATVYRATSSTPGRVFENLIILGSSPGEGYLSGPGHIRAYDVVTGEFMWRFNTIPQPGDYGYETWPKEAYRYVGGVNVWGEMSVDEARGIVFLPLGSPSYDFYGADRLGENLFGNCLVALDARTGRRLWHFQTVHHDLWDYDLVSAPQLITVERDGERIDAVAAASKQGFLFVFNRETGEPIFPIEEKPFPASDMPGEEAWPTQPVPALPPYARQIMTEDDITPVLITPAERAHWQERVAKARKGLYVPPSLDEVVSLPGAVGGVNWGNSAAHPEDGIVYLLNQDFPSFYKLAKRQPVRLRNRAGDSDEETAAAKLRGEKLYATYCGACHGPDRAGSDVGPSLLAVGSQINQTQVARSIMYGSGRMPALPHFTDEQIDDVYTYLDDGVSPYASLFAAAQKEDLPEGPVVASGGAPLPDEEAFAGGFRFNRGENDYPPGVDAPADRYFTDYGLGHPYIITPPWSTILAYDLNKGVIKWRQPLGQDRDAAAAGMTGTGVPRGSQRMGMIVTDTGLVFSTAKDGHVYAFDADNGKVLWKGALPMGAEGLPAMYEHNGRQYLVIPASTPLTWGLKSRESGIGSTEEKGHGGYVAFALPAQN
ncbi:PQQ-binding-like beta-propeller repeat protein [Actomonas aquatica]|uniref:PQQ-binding-like beta-propeller repeat protein n=1 Tax=Actomonas aquatica TaxID=2866162 RepID=A0ABZ1CB91_9BACT|nr:PQQ-binding-like beta-propeller repeat protein [Opitutus sp. WL0086]WRQ88821.1 PQQ-binding-like beta-propeller repeat protein [Opitutus sp. WL0086]